MEGLVVDAFVAVTHDRPVDVSRDDQDRPPEGHEARVLWAMISLITQHLATQRP
jgi:hypothetical protein